MNLKTTLALLVLLGCGAGLVWTGMVREKESAPVEEADSAQILGKLKPADLQRVEILRGKESTILTKTHSGWVMPGNWPTRSAEVQQLIDQLGSLESRFAAIRIKDDEELGKFGLAKPDVTVVVKTAGGEHRLAFANDPAAQDATRFDRPTYLRVDALSEVLRLGPGLMKLLDRPADYYQRRRLFPTERVSREEGAGGKVDRLAAAKLEVREGGKLKFALVKGDDSGRDVQTKRRLHNKLKFALGKSDEGWELSQPYRDALDPRTRDALLEAVPDVWAERFLPADKAKQLDELGLTDPDRVLSVTGTGGETLTLDIGKPVLEGPASNRSYARLRGSEGVFEINSDKLTPIFVPLDALRDNQLARFKSEDAREVEISSRKGKIVFRNTAPPRKPGDPAPARSEWKLVEPVEAPADTALVDRLLTALSGLSATEKDVTEKFRTAATTAATTLPALAGAHAKLLSSWVLDPKRMEERYGVSPPSATVKVTVEEKKGEDKLAVKRTVTISLGRHDKAAKKLFARSQNWPRINEIDDGLADLVLDKTSLDYRGRRVLDFLSFDVEQIQVGPSAIPAATMSVLAAEPAYGRFVVAALAWMEKDRLGNVALKRTPSGWTLTAPIQTQADDAKANDLADSLGKLEVLTFVADRVSAREMQEKYGLGFPQRIARVTFTDAKKPAKVLYIGKMRTGAPGCFARLEGAPEVFVVGNELVKKLERDSLEYRPSSLWQIAGDEIVRLLIAKRGQDEYELIRKGDGWQVVGPFTVSAPRDVVDKLTAALQSPRAAEYLAHTVTDFTPFGLDKPEVKVTLTTKSGKLHSLWIGGETTTGPGKLARLAGQSALFVVGNDLAKTVDQSALDFLDRNILKFDAATATSLQRKRGEKVLELVKKGDDWQMVKPVEQPADEKTTPELLKDLGELKAIRIAAYKPKNLKEFGLDKPEATITIKLGGGNPADHVLELGKEVADGAAERYAVVKGKQTVGVLSADVVKKLLAGPLAYRDHSLARVPDADTIKLETGERKATFAKPEGSWKLTQPLSADADHDALEAFWNSLARLRADELVVEKPTAEQLKSFGLGKPEARWQFLSGDKPALDLSVGAMEKGGTRRYARMAGKDLVFLLDAKLSGQVLAEYRSRAVFKDNVDPAQIESVRFGYQKDAFELKKVEGMWQVVGKPDVKVNSTAVSDALSGLRDLKLERYVKDAGAELKLFGLDPPELVLEATTPTGKYTLHIGGLEGSSKRRYARVPVKGQTDVFVLDEATSGKLVRNLAALTTAAP